MVPGIQLDFFEKWLPRRAALQVALGIWMVGFVVAGATAWRMHRATVGADETTGTAADVVEAPTGADGAEAESVVLMPIAVIVGLRTPKIGVAQRQKP